MDSLHPLHEYEVAGNSLSSVIGTFSHFPSMSEHLFAKVQLPVARDAEGRWTIDPAGYYPLPQVLRLIDAMGQLMGERALERAGSFIPAHATFPPLGDDPGTALRAVDVAYYLNHRRLGRPLYDAAAGHLDHGLGHYACAPDGERRLRCRVDGPYPCAFDLGILRGSARRVAPQARVEHAHGPCRARGQAACTYVAEW